MYLDTDFPPGGGRLAQFMRVAADFDQADIGFAIDALIARLDAAAGDPDLEPDDDGGVSWPEWTTGRRSSPIPSSILEDDEDCDPAEGGGDEEDGNASEDDFMQDAYTGDEGAGCPIADGSDATWPERMKQPDYMGGGCRGDMSDDAEPWHVAPHWRSVAIPANDTVPA